MSTAHHGGSIEGESELLKMLKQQRDGTVQRSWPSGRLSGDDDGQIAFSIGADESQKNVIIDFGKDVRWVAMPPEQAVLVAQMLIKHARAISPMPLTIQLY